MGGKVTGGFILADAQLTAYMRGDLSFQASAKTSLETLAIDYRYGVYFLYNMGYKAKANIFLFGSWALSPRELYPTDKVIEIYEKTGTIPLFGSGDTAPGLNQTNGVTTRALAVAPIRRRIHAGTAAILARDDDDSDTVSGANGPLAPQPSCPRRADGAWQIPELRLNCDYMKPQIVPAADNTKTASTVVGLCDPIKGLNILPKVLTYETGRSSSRRTSAGVCPTGKCAPFNTALKATTGATGYTLSCDEFPYASTEEGGEFMPASQRSATCVSAAQNYQDGQCVSKLTFPIVFYPIPTDIEPFVELLSNLESDWGHMDPSITADRVEHWRDWTLTPCK